jgi:hypothetical protein
MLGLVSPDGTMSIGECLMACTESLATFSFESRRLQGDLGGSAVYFVMTHECAITKYTSRTSSRSPGRCFDPLGALGAL